MNKEKALKNQGLEFREDMVLYGGIFMLINLTRAVFLLLYVK